MEPWNRKQRHTAAASSAEPDIPLSHSPRRDTNTPSTKTLYDIIAERQKELLGQDNGPSIASAAAADKDAVSAAPKGTRFVTVDASGAVVDADGTSSNGDENTYTTDDNNTDNTDNTSNADHVDDKPLPPFLDTILLSIPLTTLHLTLAYLAAHQYAEKTDARQLLKDSLAITLPLLTFLVHLVHGHIVSLPIPAPLRSLANSKDQPRPAFSASSSSGQSALRQLVWPPTLRTLVFLPVAALLGARLIAITNGDPYYAVMKKAPAVGTLWIWCILEMSFGAAVLGALGPLVWGVWWMGYGIF